MTPTSKEPAPGWVEGTNGPNGVMVAHGTGTLKVLFADANKHLNFIPVDFTVNLIICAAWNAAQTGTSYMPAVYNCCAQQDNELKLGNVIKLFDKMFCEIYPFSKTVFYPKYITTVNRVWFKINDLCWHYVPAVLAELGNFKSRIR